MILAGEAGRQYDGLLALGASLAIAGMAIGALLIAVSLVAWRWPDARSLLEPLHMLIVIAQVLDGATTWVGVVNPFNLELPTYQEQVFLSRVILENVGGFLYFLIKVVLGVTIVAALEFAFRRTRGGSEALFTRIVQIALVVISFIPVWNNVSNFIAVM